MICKEWDMDNIHEGHRARLRKLFLENGLDGMEPHNVLELILTYSIPRRDVNAVAHALVQEFGSFDQVLEASYDQLIQVKGVTELSAVLLKLILESYRYYNKEKTREAFYASSVSAAVNYAKSLFVGETVECSYLLCFDAKTKLIKCALVSRGTVNATAVSVRRIVEIATAARAMSVVLTHNHPNGLATPSAEDLATTKQAMRALNLIGITLSDHIIVAEQNAFSMAETSTLFSMKQELGIS